MKGGDYLQQIKSGDYSDDLNTRLAWFQIMNFKTVIKKSSIQGWNADLQHQSLSSNCVLFFSVKTQA